MCVHVFLGGRVSFVNETGYLSVYLSMYACIYYYVSVYVRVYVCLCVCLYVHTNPTQPYRSFLYHYSVY